jgi:hypothetical protein
MAQHRDLVPVTVYLPPELVAKLEALARGAYSTVSGEARRVLAAALTAQPGD